MISKQNLHTHTTYCDGADTPEEIITYALEKGFTSIGFSGHSYLKYSPMFSVKGDKTEAYKKEVSRLKEKYRHSIDIFCGLEVDFYSEIDLDDYDYLIGSVHYLMCGEKCVGFDSTAERVESIITEYFSGNGLEYAKAYYETLARLPEHGSFDIIGHFDLITKHEENKIFFDSSCDKYLRYAIDAAEALSGKIPFFELNTGAIARGYRTTPYPSLTLLKELKRLGFGAVITSDCHDRKFLDYGFNDAAALLKECGFKEQYILTKEGFKATEL